MCHAGKAGRTLQVATPHLRQLWEHHELVATGATSATCREAEGVVGAGVTGRGAVGTDLW